jgi:membrane protein DedA with SNARE-associated domain
VATPGLAFGVPALFGGLVMIEAGIPLPIPGDVLMLLVGERAAASAVPLWMAVLGLELDVLIGTAVLFFAARGPARGLIRRLGPHVGLTQQRLDRATNVFEHKGQVAIPVGRATPSLRTLTVLATAASRLTSRRALLLLFLGGSVFVQLHLVLGFFLGPVAESAFQKATVPTLIALGVLVIGGGVFWLIRHGRRRGGHAWTEATCPACMALHLIPPQARVAPHEVAAPVEA